MYNSKYPWEEWFGKGKITLRQGKHYEVGASSFAQQIRNAASRLGFNVSIKELGGRFIVWATKTEQKST